MNRNEYTQTQQYHKLFADAIKDIRIDNIPEGFQSWLYAALLNVPICSMQLPSKQTIPLAFYNELINTKPEDMNMRVLQTACNIVLASKPADYGSDSDYSVYSPIDTIRHYMSSISETVKLTEHIASVTIPISKKVIDDMIASEAAQSEQTIKQSQN